MLWANAFSRFTHVMLIIVRKLVGAFFPFVRRVRTFSFEFNFQLRRTKLSISQNNIHTR